MRDEGRGRDGGGVQRKDVSSRRVGPAGPRGRGTLGGLGRGGTRSRPELTAPVATWKGSSETGSGVPPAPSAPPPPKRKDGAGNGPGAGEEPSPGTTGQGVCTSGQTCLKKTGR